MIKVGCNFLSFKGLPMDIETFIQISYDLKLDVIDFHHRAFESDDPAYLRNLKMKCLKLGLPIGYLGTAAGHPQNEEEERQRSDQIKAAIDAAVVLGAPLVRVFGAHCPPGLEDRDPLFAALAGRLRQVAEYSAGKGVIVALQNHDNRNLAATGPDILRILGDVDHPNFSYIMDTGQWRGSPGAAGETDPKVDIYAWMEQVLPYACYVRAKFYRVASGREEILDYERIVGILKEQGYNGSLSIVYEGCEDEGRVERRVDLIRRAAGHLRELLAS